MSTQFLKLLTNNALQTQAGTARQWYAEPAQALLTHDGYGKATVRIEPIQALLTHAGYGKETVRTAYTSTIVTHAGYGKATVRRAYTSTPNTRWVRQGNGT